jgi:hypothetical protein
LLPFLSATRQQRGCQFRRRTLYCADGSGQTISGMTRLPYLGRAILDIRKLEDYCLDLTHPRGRHKARVFREALGIGRSDAAWLREALLTNVGGDDALEIAADAFGRCWRLDIPVARQGRRIMVRTIWMVRTGESAPRFVTCWVL